VFLQSSGLALIASDARGNLATAAAPCAATP
jgi:hypothetical protein